MRLTNQHQTAHSASWHEVDNNAVIVAYVLGTFVLNCLGLWIWWWCVRSKKTKTNLNQADSENIQAGPPGTSTDALPIAPAGSHQVVVNDAQPPVARRTTRIIRVASPFNGNRVSLNEKDRFANYNFIDGSSLLVTVPPPPTAPPPTAPPIAASRPRASLAASRLQTAMAKVGYCADCSGPQVNSNNTGKKEKNNQNKSGTQSGGGGGQRGGGVQRRRGSSKRTKNKSGCALIPPPPAVYGGRRTTVYQRGSSVVDGCGQRREASFGTRF